MTQHYAKKGTSAKVILAARIAGENLENKWLGEMRAGKGKNSSVFIYLFLGMETHTEEKIIRV